MVFARIRFAVLILRSLSTHQERNLNSSIYSGRFRIRILKYTKMKTVGIYSLLGVVSIFKVMDAVAFMRLGLKSVEPTRTTFASLMLLLATALISTFATTLSSWFTAKNVSKHGSVAKLYATLAPNQQSH